MNILTKISITVGMVAVLSASVMSQGKAKVTTLTCPSCKMPMSTKKSAAAPVAVHIKGKTYYCCAHCESGMKAAKAAKKN